MKGLSQQDLDLLLDASANTIGALLLHLAANRKPRSDERLSRDEVGLRSGGVKKKWGNSPNLREPAQKAWDDSA